VGGAGGAGGARATTAGSGGTQSTGFDPCPASGPCNILPLGDSITDGFGTPGGYRIELFSIANSDGHDITFVGGSNNGPATVDGQPFPQAHEGHSGWTIAQIDGIVPSPALEVDPHIILLHIGTNDMNQGVADAGNQLSSLVDEILASSPDALLAVAQIIPLPSRSTQVDTFNAEVSSIVSERAGAGAHVVLVDQFTDFPNGELADGVHPNPDGYARMADVWYTAIESYLP
jgi:lysophospholipase L1-like esterase